MKKKKKQVNKKNILPSVIHVALCYERLTSATKLPFACKTVQANVYKDKHSNVT